MIDVFTPIRKAYYSLLNGNVIINSAPVPVGDDLVVYPVTMNYWISLSGQTDKDISTFQSFDSEHDIIIDIVFKTTTRANRDVLDSIASQIMALVLPAPGTANGLPSQTGIQIVCVRKIDDRSINLSLNPSNTVIRRLLTFRQYIRQTLDNTPPMGGLLGIIKVTSSMFANATEYVDTTLANAMYEIFYNDNSDFLNYSTQWAYLPGGGFQILLPGFNSANGNYTFYLLLK